MNKVYECYEERKGKEYFSNNNFLVEVIGSDFEIKSYQVCSFHEFKNKVMINLRSECKHENMDMIEEKLLSKVTMLPKCLVCKNKKSTIKLYIIDKMMTVKYVVTYNNAVIRELLYPNYSYSDSCLTTYRITLEYGDKTYESIAAGDENLNGILSTEEIYWLCGLNPNGMKEKFSKENKEYAEKVMKFQNEMLDNAKKSVKKHYKNNKKENSEEYMKKAIKVIDNVIEENKHKMDNE